MKNKDGSLSRFNHLNRVEKRIEQDIKKEVLAPPHHEYTELLLSSVPIMDPDWLDNLLAERQATELPDRLHA